MAGVEGRTTISVSLSHNSLLVYTHGYQGFNINFNYRSEMKIRPTYSEQNDEVTADNPDSGEDKSKTTNVPTGAAAQGDEPRQNRRQKIYNRKLNMATAGKK